MYVQIRQNTKILSVLQVGDNTAPACLKVAWLCAAESNKWRTENETAVNDNIVFVGNNISTTFANAAVDKKTIPSYRKKQSGGTIKEDKQTYLETA